MRKRRSTVNSTTVDKFGRVLLPKPVRDRLGLKAGDTLRVRVQGKRAILEARKERARWIMENGIPVWTGPIPEEMHDIVAYIHRIREERDQVILERSLGKRR